MPPAADPVKGRGTTRAALLLLLALAGLSSCHDPTPTPVEDRQRGCRFVAPPGWVVFDGELRSPEASLFTIRVFDLQGGDPGFLAGLPESIVPQLEDWAKSYFILEGEPQRGTLPLGTVQALELSYAIRSRPSDPISRLTYWVGRHGSRLYVLRAAYAASALARDEAAVLELLASWSFLENG